MKIKRLRRLLFWFAVLLILVVVLGRPVWQVRHRMEIDSTLIAAIKRDDVAGVRAALHSGADPNARDRIEAPPSLVEIARNLMLARPATTARGNTALSIAADPIEGPETNGTILISARDIDIRKMLLDAGADPNATDADSNTPLMSVAGWWDTEEVRQLLDHGAKVNTKNRFGRTALIASMSNDDSSVTKLLLDNGADPDVIGADGETALSLAVMWDFTDKVSLLLAHHANPNIVIRHHDGNSNFRQPNGQNLLISARKSGFREIARLLEQYGARP